MNIRSTLKVLVILFGTLLIALGSFAAGYLKGLWDQPGSVAWDEASYLSSALRAIRTGKSDAAIELLEMRLDYHLVRHAIGDSRFNFARRIYPQKAVREGIGDAARYRLAYPSNAPEEKVRNRIAEFAERYK